MPRLQFLVMAPDGRDAAIIISQLGKASMTGLAATGDTLLAAIASNKLCGAILTIESLRSLDPAALSSALAAQASWSDCPLLVLTQRCDRTGALRAFDSLGNVMALERPMHPHSLVRAARQAMRARARQYEAEAHQQRQEAAEAQIRVMAATLETRVIARTVQLTDSLAERAIIAAQLHDSEEQYRLTIELSNQIPWSADESGGMISVGARWKQISKQSVSAVSPHGWMDHIHPDDRDRVVDEWQQSQIHGTPLDTDLRVRTPDGRYRCHRSRASALFGADRRIIKWYGTIEDVDDGRQAETHLLVLQAELAHLSRVSAMGAMASTLAHELNQPLTATTNFLRGIRRLLEQDTDGQHQHLIEAVNNADRSAARAGEIVRRLRDMVTSGGVARRAELLATLIREACALALIDAALNGIGYRVEIADERVMIYADRIQIQQVLVNLLRNAVEAIGRSKDGEIIVSARTVDEFSEIVVSDNGPGIPEATATRLFDSFNTSKPDGMGIGLSISRTIVEAHGGRISREIDHAPGTAIRFTVPNMQDPVPRHDMDTNLRQIPP